MGILSFLGSAVKPLIKLIGDMHTSDDERNDALIALTELENVLKTKYMELEGQLIQAQGSIIVAEAKSQSWLARNWRPIVMLTFATEIVLISTGWMDVEPLVAVPPQLWNLLTIGIGGYMTLRSFDKAVPDVTAAWAKKKEG